jgi:hypothetical protein
LAGRGGVAKAGAIRSEGPSMIGILSIVIFLIVIGALNFYEFGRLD